jgi:hypothetical protein
MHSKFQIISIVLELYAGNRKEELLRLSWEERPMMGKVQVAF